MSLTPIDFYVDRWGKKRLFNIEKLKTESPVFSPEMVEIQRKLSNLQRTFRPGKVKVMSSTADYVSKLSEWIKRKMNARCKTAKIT